MRKTTIPTQRFNLGSVVEPETPGSENSTIPTNRPINHEMSVIVDAPID
jgi:hypothetical protein